MTKSLMWAIMSILAVAGLDQMSKRFVVRYIEEGQLIPVVDGFFNLTLSYNRGAAFGFLAGIENDAIRMGVLWSATILAVIAVVYMFFREYSQDWIGQSALSLILGGALGNVVDRATMGEVVDFLDFYIGQYHWPAFNVADSAICVGVAILLVHRGTSCTRESDEGLADRTNSGDDTGTSAGKVASKRVLVN